MPAIQLSLVPTETANFLRGKISEIMTERLGSFTTGNLLPSAAYQVLMDMGFAPNMTKVTYDNNIVTAEVSHWILGTIGIIVDCRTGFNGGFALVKTKKAFEYGPDLPY